MTVNVKKQNLGSPSDCTCVLHLDELPWRLFVRLMHARHPVRRGLVTQEFVARVAWEDWDAELGHGPRPDIRFPRPADRQLDAMLEEEEEEENGKEEDEDNAEERIVEVKYFYWDSQNYRRTLRQALRQHRGRVPRLVLVSLVMIYPTVHSRSQPFYSMIEHIRVGVVICDMSEVTEQVLKTRPWRKVLQELLAQLPPDHEMAGLTPEEFHEEYQRYYIRNLYDAYEKAKRNQRRIKEDQQRIKEDQQRIKEDQRRIKEDQQRIKEDLAELKQDQERIREIQEQMGKQLQDIAAMLQKMLQQQSTRQRDEES